MYRECGPIKPLLSESRTYKYPCLVYCGPNPTRDKVYVQSLYHPEKVRILDLGKWKYMCGVENVLKTPEKGQV